MPPPLPSGQPGSSGAGMVAKDPQVKLWSPGDPVSAGHRESARGTPLVREPRQAGGGSAPLSSEWPSLAVKAPKEPSSQPVHGPPPPPPPQAPRSTSQFRLQSTAMPASTGAPASSASLATAKQAKHRPTETIKINLLALAMASKKERGRQEKAKKQQQQHPSGGKRRDGTKHAATRNPNPLDSTVDKVVLAGKQRAKGRKEKKKSVLKRAILRDRRAVWWLDNPALQVAPLQHHPSLIGFDCVWWPEGPPEFHSSDDDDEVEEDKVGSNDNDDDDDDEDVESDGKVGGSSSGEESAGSEEEREGAPFRDDAGAIQAQASSSKTFSGESGMFGFDAALASPVFFGCTCTLSGRGAVDAGELAKPAAAPRVPTPAVRGYVDQAMGKELEESVCSLLATLFKFQERVRAEDPIKARQKRRVVIGLREVSHAIRTKQCACVILAANIESATPLDEKLNEIVERCKVKEVPVIFATTKRRLGSAFGKTIGISAVAVLSAEGAHEAFKTMLALANEYSAAYGRIVDAEKKQGKPSRCAGACGLGIAGQVRFDCLKCGASMCAACQTKQQSQNTCAVGSETTGPHRWVKLARIPPQPKLSVKAPEFVPKFL